MICKNCHKNYIIEKQHRGITYFVQKGNEQAKLPSVTAVLNQLKDTVRHTNTGPVSKLKLEFLRNRGTRIQSLVD